MILTENYGFIYIKTGLLITQNGRTKDQVKSQIPWKIIVSILIWAQSKSIFGRILLIEKEAITRLLMLMIMKTQKVWDQSILISILI